MSSRRKFPRSLLALSDDQLAAVMAAAEPLQEADRGAFMQAIARRLDGVTMLGGGALHRALREAQRQFLGGKAIDGTRRE